VTHPLLAQVLVNPSHKKIKKDVMPSQKLMLCNYTSKYTKKILEGFYVIRTT
jgi:hypothetical protein